MRRVVFILFLLPSLLFGQEVFQDLKSTEGRELEVEHLELKGKKYSEFPEQIKAFKNLKHLSIKRAGLKQLPLWLSELPLERLILTKNKISVFPEVILELKDLQILHLGHNYLTEIPEGIAQLVMLEELDFWANEISDLPADMANLPNLKLLDLRSMDLNRYIQSEFREMFPDVELKMSPPCNCN